jgi:hypothetical protein
MEGTMIRQARGVQRLLVLALLLFPLFLSAPGAEPNPALVSVNYLLLSDDSAAPPSQCPGCKTGTVYYVSASKGSDGNDGQSEATPWETMEKVNATSLDPGDAVLFKRGDTWRDELVPSSSGKADAYILYGAYGTGAPPRILGSEQVTAWQKENGYSSVYRAEKSLDKPEVGQPASIFFAETTLSMTRTRTPPKEGMTTIHRWGSTSL